jgi:uncharacterized protein YkwD
VKVLVRPRPGRKRRLLALSIVTLALALPPASHAGSRDLAPLAACAGQTDAAAPAPVKLRAMQCLVNWARTKRGLPRLRDSRRLDRSSVLRADAIRRCGDFSHTPCGQAFTTVFQQAGYPRGARIGENIAWGGGPLGSARSVFQSWLRSPAHRRNLFRGGWRDLGIGLVSADQLFGVPQVSVWVTQFGRR